MYYFRFLKPIKIFLNKIEKLKFIAGAAGCCNEANSKILNLDFFSSKFIKKL